MKIYKLMALAAMSASLAACNNDLDQPPVILPQATIQPNTTILEVKTRYWQSDKNYAVEMGLDDQDQHLIVAGRVISNGESGNVYKSLIIQDESAALSFSINNSKLYETYAIGQEVVVDLTAMSIGKYNGLQQVGQPQAYQQGYEVSFMELDAFQEHAQFNELPEPQKVKAVETTIAELTSSTAAEHLCKWQSQLVKLDSVSWVEAGQTFATSSASANRYIKDAHGNKMLVRNSNYASFASDTIPSGTGTVVAIASYYGNDWQLLLRSVDDLIGFKATEPEPPTPGPTPGGEGEQPQGDVSFSLVQSPEIAGYYVLGIGTQVGTPVAESASYGRLALKDATFNGTVVTTTAANAIHILPTTGGYLLIDTYGRYLSMDETHTTSFQLYDSPQPGSIWTWESGHFANALKTDCKIGQAVGNEGTRFTNIAPSNSDDLVYPSLYLYTK